MKTLAICAVLMFLMLGRFCESKPPQPPPTPTPTPPVTKTLVIEKMVVNQTPQSGDWLMCFMANSEGGSSNTFNRPNSTYSGDGITIDMNLELSNVKDGEKISFKKYLDDDQADVCGNQAEDKSSGEFNVSSSGSKTFSFDRWVYTVYWRTK